MKTLILIYDSFAEFEVSLVGLLVQGKGDVMMFADHEAPFVTGQGRFQTVPHLTLSEVNVSEFDLLVIPGGNPLFLTENEAILELIREFHRQKKVLAAICAGPVLLAAAGVLNEVAFTTSYTPEEEGADKWFQWEKWTNEDVTVADNIVTAKGNAYVEFSVAVYKTMGLLDSVQDEEETLDFFKNRKPIIQ